MASLFTGYEYDIFISYRQKDNKYDGWVTEFVDNLKHELEATFKEEVSVYFDINPHDGLLETHDVDASLKDKLKCLIFIPIVSRTYCDPNSFAWEHEFKAFIEEASRDQFGLKVKLSNGNIASRILPVQIYELAGEDKTMLEKELGGILRAIQFFYKEPGVNRPLTPEDDEKKNSNNTKYRNQINKVANAIDEIIRGLKSNQKELAKEKGNQTELVGKEYKVEKLINKGKPVKPDKRKLLSGVAFLVVLIIAAVFAFPEIFHFRNPKIIGGLNGKMSIVVNTFENKTGDVTIDQWEDIIPDLLRGYLATSKELSVQNSQIMFEVYGSIKQKNKTSFEASTSEEAAKRLKADSYLNGSFQKIKNQILIVVNLISTKSREVLLTKSVEGNLDIDYKSMTDSLSRLVKNFLEIKAIEKNANIENQEAFTNSVEAYRKYIEGMKSIINGDYPIAAKTLEEAYHTDTTFTLAAFFCSFACCYFDHRQAAYWENKAYPGKERLTEDYRMWLEFWHGWFTTKNTNDIINYCNSIEKSNTKSRFILFDIGVAYNYLGKPDKSVNMFEKAEMVSSEWGEPWKYRDYYTYFADACHMAGKPDKEARVLKTGLKLFPDDIELIWGQARLALSKGYTKRTLELINKYEYLCKRDGISESEIEVKIGSLYSKADSSDRAEQYYRKALSIEPTNSERLYNLASFMIDNDRNTTEALELINKALDLRPDNFVYMGAKGWGLFKQGKYEEALNLLEKSWDLSPSYAWSNIYLHLQEVKKAISNKK